MNLLGTDSPIVAAPMAGGVTTVALARAVAAAGSFPFLAAGYKSVEAMAGEVEQLRDLPFGTDAIFVVTALVTISVDLIYAVLIGLVAAAFFALRAMARTSGVHRQTLPSPAAPGDERIALLRLDGALFFGAAERVLSRVERIDHVSVVILRMSQLQYLDATGAQALTEVVTHLERRGITVLIKGIRDTQLRLADRIGVTDSLRTREHLFEQLGDAVEHARSHVRRESDVAAA